MTLLLKDSQSLIKTDKRRIRQITEDLLTSLRLDDRALSILFVDNNTIKKLNRDWFGKDRPTNVISFSYMAGCPAPLPGKIKKRGDMTDAFQVGIIGDIAISLERAREEAEFAGRPFYERLFALIVHGLLHVQGFHHEESKNEARRMRYREKKLLTFVTSHEAYRELLKAAATGHQQ